MQSAKYDPRLATREAFPHQVERAQGRSINRRHIAHPENYHPRHGGRSFERGLKFLGHAEKERTLEAINNHALGHDLFPHRIDACVQITLRRHNLDLRDGLHLPNEKRRGYKQPDSHRHRQAEGHRKRKRHQ